MHQNVIYIMVGYVMAVPNHQSEKVVFLPFSCLRSLSIALTYAHTAQHYATTPYRS